MSYKTLRGGHKGVSCFSQHPARALQGSSSCSPFCSLNNERQVKISKRVFGLLGIQHSAARFSSTKTGQPNDTGRTYFLLVLTTKEEERVGNPREWNQSEN